MEREYVTARYFYDLYALLKETLYDLKDNELTTLRELLEVEQERRQCRMKGHAEPSKK